MLKRIFITFLFILAIILIKLESIDAETIELKVDVSRKIGSIPDILSSNMWIVKADQREHQYQIERFFSENDPKHIQFSFDVDFLATTKSFEDYKRKFKEFFHPSGVPYFFIQKIKESNAYLIIGFDPFCMPGWLSSNRGDLRQAFVFQKWWTIERCSPPKDYLLWGEVVKFALTFLRTNLGLSRLGFYVGHEPDIYWLGNEKSLLKYYEYAAKAAKEVGGDIKVGGLGSWDAVRGKKAGCDNREYTRAAKELCTKEGNWADADQNFLTKNFIKYVSKNKTPIDFINWHSFGNIPPSKFIDDATIIKKWLEEANLKDVALYPSDWTYWSDEYPADYLDTGEAASFVISALYNMWKGGIEWHGHDFNVTNSEMENKLRTKREKTDFIGDWPIFTRSGVIKPVYNAFKALSIATAPGGKILDIINETFSTEDIITAISTTKDDSISLLLSNFVPKDQKHFKKYVLAELEAQISFLELEEGKKLIMRCIKESKRDREGKRNAFFECKEKLISTIKDPKKIEFVDFIAKAYECLNNKKGLNCVQNASKNLKYPETQKAAAKLKGMLHSAKERKKVQIRFTNIPFNGKARLITYTIDNTHSNACRHNKMTEPTKTETPCGIGGAVDLAVWKAEEKAKKVGFDAARDCLLSLGYTSKEIGFLEGAIQKCKGKGDVRNCLGKLVVDEKRKRDLKEAFARYKEAYSSSYYNLIDIINKWKEVSLEGSERTEQVNIVDNKYILNQVMEPNSIKLVVMRREEK